MTVLVLSIVALVCSGVCLILAALALRQAEAARRLLDPKVAPCAHSSITVAFVGGVAAVRCASCGELLPQVMVGSGVLDPVVL